MSFSDPGLLSIVGIMKNIISNPYRLFFFIGILGLFLGTGVWIVHGLFDNSFYMGIMHARFMIAIFLLGFVAGFLMTAVPKMSSTSPANKGEVLLQLGTFSLCLISGFFEDYEKLFFSSVILNLLVLFVFCGRRIITCRHMIPDVFPMVIVSLFSGLLGAVFYLLNDSFLGGRLFYLTMILGLCIGVGAKLIPMLLRLGCGTSYRKNELWFVGFFLLASAFIESWYSEQQGNLIRAIVMGIAFFRYWKIHKFVGFNTTVANGIRLSALSIFAGTLGIFFFPDFRLEGLHMIYISGFALLTVLVASRVILANGGFDLSLEFKNWFLRVPVVLILIASFMRVLASFTSQYEIFLGLAAFSFLAGMTIWGIFFIPKLGGLRS